MDNMRDSVKGQQNLMQMMLTNCERNGAVAGGREGRRKKRTEMDNVREEKNGGQKRWMRVSKCKSVCVCVCVCLCV